MSQCQSGVLVGKKRKWDVAALGSDISGVQSEFDRTGMTARDETFCQDDGGGDGSLRQLGSVRDELSAPLIPIQSPIALPRLGTMVDPINPHSSPNMSTEEFYFNPGEGQTHGLDLLQDFDAPILQIMNSVPALTNGWAAQGDIVDINTEASTRTLKREVHSNFRAQHF
ncbi:unnamed protein product [Penicillium salamii]|uniref:Uncharacterized protein n=1 Tax=Penicillium salamii TaxID=1612424 RepID=A0A9W4ICA4_9EURO|nr:unnamed protein product [Penicillium salamii]CAG8218097.1 unnamed protein product [Penicillium salamii]CAG8254125.1 unnamed protein product [Penicillium salamii]CAG8256996.1 unnamed protein product [Penicillium salamii]CAG8334630.1 unnamed protein product [Penicillium salamii]